MNGNGMYFCYLCKNSFKMISQLNTHIDLYHENEMGDGDFKCSTCEKSFKCDQSLMTHNEAKHKGTFFNCNQCDYKATRSDNIKKHIKYVHEGMEFKFKCDNCSERFKVGFDLKNHIKIVHENSNFKCTHEGCEATYLSAIGLRTHRKSHGPKKFSCNQCDSKYHVQSKLNQHIREIHQKLIITCKHCEYTTTRAGSLYAHLYNKHDVPRTNRPSIHEMRKINDAKLNGQSSPNLQCNDCDYIAKSSSYLSMHKKGKHGGRKKCPSCDNTYTWNGDLLKHIRVVHNGEKTKCSLCEYVSTYKSNLKVHMRTHHGISDVKCDKCEKMFDIQWELTDHILAVHEGKMFTCEHCGLSYDNRSKLSRHMKDKHLSPQPVLNELTGRVEIKMVVVDKTKHKSFIKKEGKKKQKEAEEIKSKMVSKNEVKNYDKLDDDSQSLKKELMKEILDEKNNEVDEYFENKHEIDVKVEVYGNGKSDNDIENEKKIDDKGKYSENERYLQHPNLVSETKIGNDHRDLVTQDAVVNKPTEGDNSIEKRLEALENGHSNVKKEKELVVKYMCPLCEVECLSSKDVFLHVAEEH